MARSTPDAGAVTREVAEKGLQDLPGTSYMQDPHGAGTVQGAYELLITIPSVEDHVMTYTLLLPRQIDVGQ